MPKMAPTTILSTLPAANTTMLDPASGRPNVSSLRAVSRSNPNRMPSGAKLMNSTAPMALPASDPTARLIAPMPASAQTMDVTGLTIAVVRSATVRLSCRKSRCSRATGTATRPLMMTLRVARV